MDKELKKPIIEGVITVFVAFIVFLLYIVAAPFISPTISNIEIIDVGVVYHPVCQGSGAINLTHLDFKIKNTGNEVAIIKNIDIKVLNNAVDYTPRLVYKRNEGFFGISMSIKNFGWGPAKNVTFKDFQNIDSTLLFSIFDLEKNSLLWQGDVNEGSEVTIEYPFKKNLTIDALANLSSEYLEILGNSMVRVHLYLYGKIEYYDIYGSYYTDNSVGAKNTSFDIAIINKTPRSFFYPYPYMSIYANYTAELSSESKTPYTKSVPVSQVVHPNKADRFSIELNSDKTAIYDIIVYLNYDGEIEETKCMKVKIEKLNQ